MVRSFSLIIIGLSLILMAVSILESLFDIPTEATVVDVYKTEHLNIYKILYLYKVNDIPHFGICSKLRMVEVNDKLKIIYNAKDNQVSHANIGLLIFMSIATGVIGSLLLILSFNYI